MACHQLRRVVAVCLLTGTVAGLTFRINTTLSAPLGVYGLTWQEPRPGDLVVACLPTSISEVGVRRGYLSPGLFCPGGSTEVLKRAVAFGGSTVTVGPTTLAVDGTTVATFPALPARDSRGLPFSHFLGCLGIAPGDVFLLGVDPARSWDSRSYGPVPTAAIRSTLELLGPDR